MCHFALSAVIGSIFSVILSFFFALGYFGDFSVQRGRASNQSSNLKQRTSASLSSSREMTPFAHGHPNSSILLETGTIPYLGTPLIPLSRQRSRIFGGFIRGNLRLNQKVLFEFSGKRLSSSFSRKTIFTLPRDSASNSSGSSDDSSDEKTPFGYTRKDVLLIGLGLTLLGIGLKSGLEFAGVDSLQAGNVVQLILVLGLTIGWIFTYIFRVSNKEMTYAKQLRDYEYKVMEKRLDGLTEAELEALLEQVEEEKRLTASGEQ